MCWHRGDGAPSCVPCFLDGKDRGYMEVIAGMRGGPDHGRLRPHDAFCRCVSCYRAAQASHPDGPPGDPISTDEDPADRLNGPLRAAE